MAPKISSGSKGVQILRKLKRWAILLLCLLLPAGISLGGEQGLPPEFDEAAVYIPQLEAAMDAWYGSRDAWPQGFDTFLAVARYYGGLDAAYASALEWAPDWLQALEANAIPGTANKPQALPDFLSELRVFLNSDEPLDPLGWAWPYEAHALATAAYVYSGHASYSNYAALPPENALPLENAIAIAREAIQKQYALSDEDIGQYPVYAQFFVGDWFGPPFWGIVIGLNDLGHERYYAYIASPSGEILVANRNDANG